MSGSPRRAELPLLVLGPALGPPADALWRGCAAGLGTDLDLLAWDLPGHGHNRAVPDEPFDLADLARGLLVVVEDVLVQRGEPGGSFAVAGVGAGGAVGLQLLLDHPGRVTAAAVIGTGARSAVEQDGDGPAGLLAALAGWDVSDRLGEVAVPLLVVAGEDDARTPPVDGRALAGAVRSGRHVALPGVGHLAPSEAPERVVALLRAHLLGEDDVAIDPASPWARAIDHLAGRPGPEPAGLDERTRLLVDVAVLAAAGAEDALARRLHEASDLAVTPDEVAAAIVGAAQVAGTGPALAALRLAARVLPSPGR